MGRGQCRQIGVSRGFFETVRHPAASTEPADCWRAKTDMFVLMEGGPPCPPRPGNRIGDLAGDARVEDEAFGKLDGLTHEPKVAFCHLETQAVPRVQRKSAA